MTLKSYAEVTPLEPEWEIPGLMPKSFVTLAIGDGGVGKGQLWSDWAGRMTTGRRMPNADEDTEPEPAGSVLLITSEDDPNMSTAWRLRAAHADLDRVYDMTDNFSIPESLPELAERIDEVDARMVVIDPLADNLGFIPGTKRQISLTSGNVTLRRYVMRPLEALARDKGISLLVIHHTVKSGRMAGSKGISDAARMVLRITRPDETKDLRLISVEKTNIASGMDAIGYTISGEWPDVHIGYVDAPSEDSTPARQPTVADRVLSALRGSESPLTSREVMGRPGMAGASYGSVRVALTRLRDAGLVWQPPEASRAWAVMPEAPQLASVGR